MTRRVKILLVGLAILSGIGALVLLSPSQDAVLERNLAVLREHHPETAERLAEAEAMLQDVASRLRAGVTSYVTTGTIAPSGLSASVSMRL